MGETLEIKLAADCEAPQQARAFVDCFTRERLSDRQCEQAQLLVSELASNAVVYGSTAEALLLQLALDEDQLRVDLTDGGLGFEPRNHPRPHSDRGFGLFLIDTSADRWGVEQEGRCCVWFELDR